MRQNYSFSKNSNALLEPCEGKLSCTVWSGGKFGGEFTEGLPITIGPPYSTARPGLSVETGRFTAARRKNHTSGQHESRSAYLPLRYRGDL